MKSKVHFVSLGCPKNLVDSEIMLGSLAKNNYEIVEQPEEAETVVINTCGFIQSAREESIGKILEIAELKAEGTLKNLVVTGCLVQKFKEELVEELPEVDLFIGSGEFQKIHEILESRRQGETRKNYFSLPTFLQTEETHRINSQPFYTSYLKISEGCLKRCSFCSIPSIRGNLQSREISSIVHEAQHLVSGGVKEINIISHDFTDYAWDLRRKNKEIKYGPLELLDQLSKVKGVQWIRVLYMYPDGITQELIDLYKNRPQLVKYFDIPLQHINDEILKKMNRKTSRADIENIIKMIRTELPEAVIRTQFIVGYPGETVEQFNELLEFVKEHKFDHVGCFAYSVEEGTPSSQQKPLVEEDEKERRYQLLMETQLEISQENLKRYIGKTVSVLIEGASEETDLLLQGRMATQAPEIDGVVLINEGDAQVGEMVQVEITEAMEYDLIGRII